MKPTVQRLGKGWEAAVASCLMADLECNLFLVGFVRSQPMDRAYWYGLVDGSRVLSVALLVPDRLLVPYSEHAEHADALGQHLRNRFDPCMVVGPREACDRVWDAWTEGELTPDRFYDQRLYVLRDRPAGEPILGFRLARLSEWRTVAHYSGLMEAEDLGRNPHEDQPALHERVVRDRIRAGRCWVIAQGDRLVFQINVGTAMDLGSQVGGTFVPRDARGRGLATAGMHALGQRLLDQHPFVSLHVNEANLPAVRVYEKVGFQRRAAFRLITVSPT